MGQPSIPPSHATEPTRPARAATITAPTLVADGTADELDPVNNSHTLANLIPASKLHL